MTKTAVQVLEWGQPIVKKLFTAKGNENPGLFFPSAFCCPREGIVCPRISVRAAVIGITP